ncbi:MAG: LuxR C-terminal-related transcriptional regulator [Anaerolineae bacterium]|nr:LuxR C-terminal-related transcriptional regulator [Anaerolineae bacterium]
MNIPVLTTKLNAPHIPSDVLSRPCLIHQLNEGLRSGHRLLLLSAPAGYGKTILLSLWLKQLETLDETLDFGENKVAPRTAWLSLDAGDDDPVRFITYLLNAFHTIIPGIEKDSVDVSQSPPSPSQWMHPLLARCINQIAAVRYPIVLVLDDYHTIFTPDIHKAVTFLLDNGPRHFHLVIATRADPPLPIARLRGRRQLTELRQTDLKFSEGEIDAFLKHTMGLTLSQDEVTILTERTEGWITGLQMAGLVMQKAHKVPISEFLENLSGRQEYIVDYFVDEVLESQPVIVKEFLLQTSILPRMCSQLCDAVCEGQIKQEIVEKGQPILDYLQEANLFVIPLDHERQWFRYHHLFADLLQQRLLQSKPERISLLHLRASQWFGDNGFPGDAIDHALKGKNDMRAADLMETEAERMLMRGEFVTFKSWFRRLKREEAQRHPVLCFYYAVILLLSGASPEQVHAYLGVIAAQDIAVPVTQRTVILHAVLALWRGDAAHSIRLGQQALSILPDSDVLWRGVVTGNLGIAELYLGTDLNRAARLLREAVKLGERAGNVMGAVIALCNLAELRILEGQLHAAHALYERAQKMAVDTHGHPLPLKAMTDIGLAGLLHEWDALDKAEHMLKASLDLGLESLPFWGMALDGHLVLARIKQSQGDVHAAQEALTRSRLVAEQTASTELDNLIVAVTQARFWIARDQLDAAARWARSRGYVDTAPIAKIKASGDVFYALFELELLALEVLDFLAAQATTRQRIDTEIKALVLISLVHEANNQSDKAIEVLEKALTLAHPGGYVRTFTERGAPMIKLLRQAGAHDRCVEDVQRLLKGPVPVAAPYREQHGLVEPLSTRELDVLRLLADHLTSSEISQQLYISTNTVRYHLKNIYTKLHVHSRRDAVLRAQELHLV